MRECWLIPRQTESQFSLVVGTIKGSWKLPESLRITPFLHFLDCKLPDSRGKLSSMAIRTWVIDRTEEETRLTRKASHVIRRDLAMLACLCQAPEKGPRATGLKAFFR
jgi:hypothetical protein